MILASLALVRFSKKKYSRREKYPLRYLLVPEGKCQSIISFGWDIKTFTNGSLLCFFTLKKKLLCKCNLSTCRLHGYATHHKTQIVLVSDPRANSGVSDLVHVQIDGHPIPFSTSVKNLAVIFYKHLNMEAHIRFMCRSCMFHLRNISNIRCSLSHKIAEQLILAFVTSRLCFSHTVGLMGWRRLILNICWSRTSHNGVWWIWSAYGTSFQTEK